MAKTPKSGPGYSQDREWTVVLEDLRAQFRTFGEGLQDVRRRIGNLEIRFENLAEDLLQVKIDVAVIKSAFQPFARQVSDHERRINGYENRLIAIEKVR